MHSRLTYLAHIFSNAMQVYSTELVAVMSTTTERLLSTMQETFVPDHPWTAATHLGPHTWAQTLFILLQSPLNSQGRGHSLLQGITTATASLSQHDMRLLREWLEKLPAEVLAARNVRPLHGFLEGVVQRQV